MYSDMNMCHVTDAGNGYIICRVLEAFGIKNENKIYTKGELAALKASVKVFEM